MASYRYTFELNGHQRTVSGVRSINDARRALNSLDPIRSSWGNRAECIRCQALPDERDVWPSGFRVPAAQSVDR
jgi:hypothetical protein